MNLNFDIPTPKSCGDCKFGYTDKNEKDHIRTAERIGIPTA